jgi:adenine phosphoribosyltransferase
MDPGSREHNAAATSQLQALVERMLDIKQHIRAGNGAADITPLLADRALFQQVVAGLAVVAKELHVDKVACIEGRGFLLGSAVAYCLTAGLIPLRHAGHLKSAMPTVLASFIDYTRTEKQLEMQGDAVVPGERILVVDDWVETGATVLAALELIQKCGGVVVGISVLIDDAKPVMRARLSRYNYHFLAQTAQGDQL